MSSFEYDFEMKQGMIWEISGQVLRGYWLTTCIRSMVDCHVIEKWEKQINRKRNSKKNIYL